MKSTSLPLHHISIYPIIKIAEPLLTSGQNPATGTALFPAHAGLTGLLTQYQNISALGEFDVLQKGHAQQYLLSLQARGDSRLHIL